MTFDLAHRIGDIARHLLGEPNQRLSTRNQLRFGTSGSVAIEITGAKKGNGTITRPAKAEVRGTWCVSRPARSTAKRSNGSNPSSASRSKRRRAVRRSTSSPPMTTATSAASCCSRWPGARPRISASAARTAKAGGFGAPREPARFSIGCSSSSQRRPISRSTSPRARKTWIVSENSGLSRLAIPEAPRSGS